MNFDFLRECKLEDAQMQEMYDDICRDLEKAEWKYWRAPQECGIILRGVAEKVCRVYNFYYDIGCPVNYALEEFLCYSEEEAHNAQVSYFLSTVRTEQRDRLNRLRILGDDCIWGGEAPERGMPLEERMAQNAKKMMETVMEVLRDMCVKINKRDDVSDVHFLEEELPEKRQDVFGEAERGGQKKREKGWLGRFFSRKGEL